MRITINEDADFLIADEFGDVPEGAELGLYHEDARFLSAYQLRVGGAKPVLLASRAIRNDMATYFLTNPSLTNPALVEPSLADSALAEPSRTMPRGLVGITRRQWIDQGLRETVTVEHYGERAIALDLDLDFDADFGHVFEVKHAVDTLHERTRRQGEFTRLFAPDGRSATLRFQRDGQTRELRVTFTAPATATATGARFALCVAPRERWAMTVTLLPYASHEPSAPPADRAARHARRLAQTATILRGAPKLTTDSLVMRQAYEQSVRDFAALRIDADGARDDEYLIAAGIPWFMTLFGRDSLIAGFQALPFFPEAAKGVLRGLARLQGTKVDSLRVEEPGKILHEYRNPTFMGTKESAAVFPYYGTIDATPLFLMLLAAVWRVTADRTLIGELRAPMLRALAWMDAYGDRDGDGYLEYLRVTEAGLANQGWKDSGDSVRFRDGRMAAPPIALAEVQGYAYAARLGVAEVADALGDAPLATAQRARAAALQATFNRDFWLPERGFFALALDRDKRPVDALTSNPGHLLWTGIAAPERAAAVAARLLSPALFSGWGVRTMAVGEGAYNPISYHNGTVWPHDTSLIIAGLARYGFTAEAATLTHGLLEALELLPDQQFPELFAGYSREESGFPVAYPTASRPQAWSSCAVLLLLTAMAGLDATQTDLAPPFLPAGMDRARLAGLWRGGQRGTVEVIRVDATTAVARFRAETEQP